MSIVSRSRSVHSVADTAEYFYGVNEKNQTVAVPAASLSNLTPDNAAKLTLMSASEDGTDAADVYAAAAADTTESGFLQFIRPVRYGDGGTYADRRAIVTLRRERLTPTSIDSTINSITIGKGDNTTFIGVSGAYFQSRDDATVDASTKGVLYGAQFSVVPTVARNNIPYDDVACIVLQNDATVSGARGTDCIYVGRNSTTFPDEEREWVTGLTMGANTGYAFRTTGANFCGLNLSGKMSGTAGGTYGVLADGSIQTSVTGNAYVFRSEPTVTASAAVGSLFHFSLAQGALGSGASLSGQHGFYVGASMTGATNNYGFNGGLEEATGVWNFFGSGTAWNSFAGNTGIGTTTLTGRKLAVSGDHTGATTSFGVLAAGTVKSDVTTAFNCFATAIGTEDAAFTLPTLVHYLASQDTVTGGSRTAPTVQYGFRADSSLTGATTNYGFQSNIAAGTGRWNFYAAGTAKNYFGGDVVLKLGSSVTPANNTELMVELTSNTSLTFKVKGSDGTVRSASITLA